MTEILWIAVYYFFFKILNWKSSSKKLAEIKSITLFLNINQFKVIQVISENG